MAEFFISVVVFAFVIAAMAIGVMSGRAPIKGSCGGMGAMGMTGPCEICGGDTQRCEQQSSDTGAAARNPGLYRPADK